MTKAILFIAVLAFVPGALQAQQQSCYLVYQTTRFHCYEYVDPTYGYMGQCNSYDVYSTDCYYTAENPIVIEPPGFFGGGVVDPAWMYVSAIDDTDPANIRVKVSASNQLDLFSLSYNAAPYGTGYGTGDVWISGVPARDLGGSGTFYVQGCDTEGGICAAASTNTWVTELKKRNSAL